MLSPTYHVEDCAYAGENFASCAWYFASKNASIGFVTEAIKKRTLKLTYKFTKPNMLQFYVCILGFIVENQENNVPRTEAMVFYVCWDSFLATLGLAISS